jgi:hypothetical protein
VEVVITEGALEGKTIQAHELVGVLLVDINVVDLLVILHLAHIEIVAVEEYVRQVVEFWCQLPHVGQLLGRLLPGPGDTGENAIW